MILATHGEHRFFSEEAKDIRDIRRWPFYFGGYSVSYREGRSGGHVSVKIEKERLSQLQEYFFYAASRASVEDLVFELRSFSFPSFAQVRTQVFYLVQEINAFRRLAGLERIPADTVIPRWGRN